MAANAGLELLQHQPYREQNQVATHDATRTHPLSAPNGRTTNAIVAGDVGSVHTEYVLYLLFGLTI